MPPSSIAVVETASLSEGPFNSPVSSKQLIMNNHEQYKTEASKFPEFAAEGSCVCE
jgi:hypothetical protein